MSDQRPERDQWLVRTVMLMILQYSLLVVQRVEIIIFDSHIAQHLPTMAEPEKSNWVSLQFSWLAIGPPVVAQLILMPAIFWCCNKTKLTEKQKWIVCVSTVLLSLFAICQAWACVGLTAGAFD